MFRDNLITVLTVYNTVKTVFTLLTRGVVVKTKLSQL